MAIIDSQSVKTTEQGGPKGKDAFKMVDGRKRHILVDTLGMILAVVVHSAGIQDRDGAKPVLEEIKGLLPPAEEDPRRRDLQRRDRRLGQGVRRLGAGDRPEAGEEEGGAVQGGEVAVDRGADVRLAGAESPVEQGLRAPAGVERGRDLHRHDPSDAPTS